MSDLIGTTILDRYRVDSFIGRGGMAQVYKAWDVKRSVHVALKLLNEDLAEDYVFLRRFAREARALELLQHPHIVRFFGFEEIGRLAFLVMEYVDGLSLRAQLKLLGRPLSLPEALAVFKPVCGALHYAHQMDVLHCDVKPANILIERGGRVVLSDFGIAQLTESATVTFSTPGTPAYMSPEQCRGEELDVRTDVYSLGITAYEILTLDRPFKGDTDATTGSRGERVRWEQMHVPAPSPRGINPGIPPAAEAAVLKTLEKRRSRRPQGALDFYQDLSQGGTSEAATNVPWTAERDTGGSEVPLSAPRGPQEEERALDRPLATMGAGAIVLGTVTAVLIVGLLAFILGRRLLRPSATPAPVVSPLVVVATPTSPPSVSTTTSKVMVSSTSGFTPTPNAGLTPSPATPSNSWTRPADGATMMYVPASTFSMGSSQSDSDADADERPQHIVRLSPYYVDRYEVTVAQFRLFAETTGYDTDAERRGWGWVWRGAEWERVDGANWRHPTGLGSSVVQRDAYPVTVVSWNDASAYCRSVGARLPTEAEWENGARGSDARRWPWGDFWEAGRANSAASGLGWLASVADFPEGASPYDLFNMAGNVWEWVADWYDEDYYARSPNADPRNDVPGQCPGGSASDQCRVMRGGSWRNNAAKIRAANRTYALPTEGRNDFGFRCAMDVP